MNPYSKSRHPDQSITLLLVALVVLVYLFLFRGLPISTDEVALFTGTQSFSLRGQFSATPLYWNTNGTVLFGAPGHAYPSFEPAQMVAAAPLYWIGRQFPSVGMLHVVWLFNILVTATQTGLLYLISRRLGYSTQVGFALALVYAFTSIALPYALTFFREPLNTLALLFAFYGLIGLKSEQTLRHSAVNGAWIGVGLGLAYATKVINIALAPIYIAALLWVIWRSKLRTAPLLICAVALPILFMIFAVQMTRTIQDSGTTIEGLARQPTSILLSISAPNWAEMRYALWGYLFSPGKSLFLYTPFALLGVLTIPWAWRRHPLPTTVCIVTSAVMLFGYAATKSTLWFGGLNWGPRFLVPATPFLLMLTLPSIELALERRKRIAQIAVTFCAVVGIGVQLLSILVPISRYSEAMYKVAPNAMWTLAIEQWVYSQLFYSWQLIDPIGLDFQWLRLRFVGEGIDWWSPVVIMFGIGWSLWFLLNPYRREQTRRWQLLGLYSVVIVAMFLLLRNGVNDPRLPGGNDRLALSNLVNATARVGDALILSDSSLTNYFLNTLTHSLPLFAIDKATGTLQPRDESLFLAIQNEYERVWLISTDSPSVQPQPRAQTRPDEAWWAARTGRLLEQEFSPYSRVSLFVNQHKVENNKPIQTQLGTDLHLDRITWTQTSEWINGALYWHVTMPITANDTIFLQLLDQDGRLRWQSDHQPQIGFAPMSTWQAGQEIADPFAISLTGLPPGNYHLIGGVYFFDEIGNVQRLTTPDGRNYLELLTLDHLPTRVE